ncbi:YihY family inner membrane protein [Ketobacter alkanivorans]|uniref:YihY family inner membrane protein n=1 Tax=Ketobacter alkanivorans TaxID=1917421 RepID=UPI00131503AF|nr:YihY family inner membrane protein [Ketobacter alkanivorans]
MDALFDAYKQFIKLPPVAFVVYVAKSFLHHGNGRSAFYLAFTSLFAVVPVMTVVYSILALIPELKGMESKMQNFMFEHFVPATGSQLQEHLHGFAQQASNLTSIGVIMLFVTSVLMLRKIENSFNTIWHITEARKGVNGFLLYWALLSLGPVMMGGAFAVSSYLASLKMIYDMVPLAGTQTFVLSLLPILMSGLAFSLAYVAIPNTRVPIRHGLLGGLVAAILFDLARRGMTLFVSMFPTYHLVYGAFAAVPIFLIWVLVSWNIMLLGAEIVQAMTSFQVDKKRSTSSLGNLLAVLETLYRLQGKGEVIDEVVLLQKMPWVSNREWEAYTDTLINVQLIHRNGEGEIALTRDLHKYSLAQLFRDCFGDTIKMDLQSNEGWQGRVNKLYKDGMDTCLSGWDIPLAELYDVTSESVEPSSQ